MNSKLRAAARFTRNTTTAAIAATLIACGGSGSGYGSGGGGGGGGGGPPPPPSAYTLSPLVSDGWTVAAATDAHLHNPWGLAALPTGPMWVANNQDHSSTIYDGTGLVQPLVVNLAVNGGGAGDVTGIVASTSGTDFMLTNGTVSAPARFVFATEDGTLLGWSPNIDPANAMTVYQDAGGAQYTGLATAGTVSGTLLYAADFHNGRIDIFDSTFARLDGANKFVDAMLPAGFAPFNIQAVRLQGSIVLAVAYAMRDAVSGDEVAGAGLGVVDIYTTSGTLLSRLIAQGGQLNAPWGIAVAPADFGTLSDALLVGNFGDGHINGFNPTTGAFLQAIGDANGAPIVVGGLWGMAFGNGARNQPSRVLYVAAGSNDEANGLYARIDLGATAPDIIAPTGVALTAPAAAATVDGSITVSANAADNVGVARVVFSVHSGATTTDIGTDTAAPFSVTWNTGTVANGPADLTATAYDAYGNATASPPIAVTVDNVPDLTPPVVALTAPAAGDVTGTVTVSADATDNVGVAQVQFFSGATSIGTDTSAPYSVQWNTAGFTGTQQLTAVARDGAGNTTTSAAVTVTVTAAAVPTLAQLQSGIFTPRCSGCHNGSGGVLPGSMNLSNATASFNALVNVSSQEVASLKRVLPGNPDSSYIVRKLEGTQSVGERMPFGGPYLDQATIDQVREWIQAGAAP
jgi:uncharacterized protein (TIGR03118 family)